MDQQDFYLHEEGLAAGAGPGTPGGGSLGEITSWLFATCAHDVTLNAQALWPDIQSGDLILAQIMPSEKSLADETHYSLPQGWNYIHWQAYRYENGGNQAGPGCHWAYTVWLTGDPVAVFSHRDSDPARTVCMRAFPLSGIDPRAPVDFLTVNQNALNFGDYSLSATDGGVITGGLLMPVPRRHAAGSIQVTSVGTEDTDSRSLMFGTMRGPSSAWAMLWAKNYASNRYSIQGVWLDLVGDTSHTEYTGVRPANSASGGLLALTGVNVKSLSWTVDVAGREGLEAEYTATTAAVKHHKIPFVLSAPGVYAGWAELGNQWNTIGGPRATTYLKVTAPSGAYRGQYFYLYRVGNGFDAGANGLENPFSFSTWPSGLPYRGHPIVGGEFTASETGTWQLEVGLASTLNHDTASVPATTVYGGMVGVSRLDESVLLPTVDPTDRMGIGRYLSANFTAPWVPLYEDGSIQSLGFMLTPSGANIRLAAFRSVGHPWHYGTKRMGAALVNESCHDSTVLGQAITERPVWPSYVGGGVRRTGRYYWELTSRRNATGGGGGSGPQIGIVPPQSPQLSALSNRAIGRRRDGANISAPNTIPGFSLSYSASGTFLSASTVWGFRLDYEDATFQMSRGGVVLAAWAMSGVALRLPYHCWVQMLDGTVDYHWYQWRGNFTGPFDYAKPAGHVAYDWINEVSA